MKKIFLMIFALASALTIQTYRRDDFAICFIGGLDSIYGQPNPIACAIRDTYPDIPFVELKIGDGTPAATKNGMYRQLGQLYDFALKASELKDRHVILIGGSQGGLLAQAFVELYRHRLPFVIDSLMTIASPLGGQYGLPDGWEAAVDTVIFKGDAIILQKIIAAFGLKDYQIRDENHRSISLDEAFNQTLTSRKIVTQIRTAIADLVKKMVRKNFGLIRFVFYNPIGQDLISVAGYWRDPLHRLDYLAFNSFLPYINNEREHVDAAQYKENISALTHVAFLWAGKDNVIKPPCSGAKRFYRWESKTDLEASFTDTMQYKQDLLGFGTMFDDGRLTIRELPNDTHACSSPEAIAIGLDRFATIVGATKTEVLIPLTAAIAGI